MEGNNNLSQENIASRISQLKNGQNNNSLNKSQNGFPSALPQTNPSNIDSEENVEQIDSEEEVVEETYNQGNNLFESSAMSLFSSKSNDSGKADITGFANKALKAKKTLTIISAAMPFVLPAIIIIIVIVVVMGQIMTVRDNINQLVTKFTTGIEKFVNFAQGDGWMTNEDSFFYYLDEQYNNFEKLKSSGDSLDIPLIAATIHYSKQVDFEKYEELEQEDVLNYESEDFEQLGGSVTKEKTASFYTVAKEKLGSVSSIYPGQKRLLGHLSQVSLEPGFYDSDSASQYWNDFFSYALNIINDTGIDIKDETVFGYVVNPIGSFLALYENLEGYLKEYGDLTYGMRYDIANNIYELQEFFHSLTGAYDIAKNGSTANSGLFFSIKVTTSMNTGYDEYQDLKQTTLEIKSALTKNNIEFSSDEDAIEKAKNSSNSQIKSLYDKYEEINKRYMYSYTHYLQTLYIPYTYFYKQDYTPTQVDIIIDEIYDQRDFYNYLIDEEEDSGDFSGWKQCGAPWSNIVIGDGKTICDIGCLATAVSIQIARSGVPIQNVSGEFNPGTFVQAIKPDGFIYYDSNGNAVPGGTLFVYNSVSKVAPTFKYQGDLHISLTGKTRSQKASEIRKMIQQGCYVVMEVKGGGGGQHWVAVDRVDGDTVYMMDPASNEVDAWKQYPDSWTSQGVCYKVTG